MKYLSQLDPIIWINCTIGLLSCLGVGVYRRYAFWRGILAYPNDRNNHKKPTPVGAGIVFVLLWLCAIFLAGLLQKIPYQYPMIFWPSFIVAIIGYLDDRHNLSAFSRMPIQFFAALMSLGLLGGITGIHLNYSFFSMGILLGSLISVFAIVWSLNLFNFMDGLDGFASTEAIFILLLGGLLLWWVDAHELATIAWLLVAALVGFLIWNWPKAKVFMGDTGSTFLGFIIPLFALIGDRDYQLSCLYWIMLYSIFIADTSITLIRRLLNKEPWHQAHRDHAFQRLLESGFTHQQILHRLICANSIIAILVMIAYRYPHLFLPMFILNMILVSGIYLWIEKRKPMRAITP